MKNLWRTVALLSIAATSLSACTVAPPQAYYSGPRVEVVRSYPAPYYVPYYEPRYESHYEHHHHRGWDRY